MAADRDITKDSIVFCNDENEPWMTNLVTEVLEDCGDGTVIIATRGLEACVSKQKLMKLPVDTTFQIYVVTRYSPKYDSQYRPK